MDIKKKLTNISEQILFNEPMKNHTTFRVGGPADIFCEPQSTQELYELLQLFNSQKLDVIIIGNGSNLLVGDLGIRGAVIKIGERMSDTRVDGTDIFSFSGILLSRLAVIAQKAGLSGLECLSGIPGSLGGAIYMNAGAYGEEISQIIKNVTYITANGEIKQSNKEELNFSYRKSTFTNSDNIILSCTLSLKSGNSDEIASRMRELSKKRNEKQPLNFPSAGSTFKRPEGNFAGKLIEDCGLKGYQIGGAKISEKHAGFIVNFNNATARDILDLINHVQTTVFKHFGIKIEPEVKIIGEQ